MLTPKNKKATMIAFLLVAVALAIIATFMVRQKTSLKSAAIAIVTADEWIRHSGKARLEMNEATGKLEPQRQPDELYFFRVSKSLPNGFSGKAGGIYRIDKNGNFQEVGSFDINKTDEELEKEHLTK